MNRKLCLLYGAIALVFSSLTLADPPSTNGASLRDAVALVRDFRMHDAATTYKKLPSDDAADFIDWLVQAMQVDTSELEQHPDVMDFVDRCKFDGSKLPSERCAELHVRSSLAILLCDILSPVRSLKFQKNLLNVIKDNPENPVIRQAFATVALSSASFDDTYLEIFDLVMQDSDNQVAQSGYVAIDKQLSQALKIIDTYVTLISHPDPQIRDPARTRLDNLRKQLRHHFQ